MSHESAMERINCKRVDHELWLASQDDQPGLSASWMADSESYWRGLVGEFQIVTLAARRRGRDVGYWADDIWSGVVG